MAISATMPAITHVAVTVTDLDASEAWYTRVLGIKPVIDEDTGPYRHIVYELGNTLLGLHGFPDLAGDEPFDERKPGLDHIAAIDRLRRPVVGPHGSPAGCRRSRWHPAVAPVSVRCRPAGRVR
ncbi:MAG: VOC family protein [Pseudonocardiales bacterium]|nr:VOC family protein [Pseudonocardiales bacterium]